MYTLLVVVEVGVRELRANLSAWLDRVQEGDEVIVTERGRPVARLIALSGENRLQELIAEGRLTPAREDRAPIDQSKLPKMPPGLSLSDVLMEERRKAPY